MTPSAKSDAAEARSRWRRAGRMAGGLLVGLAALLCVEHLRGRLGLARHVARLADRGEKLRVAELLPAPAAVASNAAPLMFSLTNRADGFDLGVLQLHPGLGRFAVPGKAVVAWRLTNWTDGWGTSVTWRAVGTRLQGATGALAVVRAAAKLPHCEAGFDYQKGFVDFHLGPISTFKNGAQLLATSVDLELSRGHGDAALRDLLALTHLAARQRGEPLIICELVRQAAAAAAIHATWSALQAGAGTDADLAAVQSAWAAADYPGDLLAALEVERALQHEFFVRVRTSAETRERVLSQRESWGTPFNTLATEGAVLHWINLPLWQVAWARQDELRALRRWEPLIDQLRRARSNSWAAAAAARAITPSRPTFIGLPGEESIEPWFDRFRFIFSTGRFAVSEQLLRRTFALATQQQLAITALALHRFQRRAGRFPEALAELVPGLVRELPRDPMDGASLRYRRLPSGGFALYSTGLNGVDDGGDATPPAGPRRFRSMMDGRDMIWPDAASPAEEAEATARRIPSRHP